MASYNFQGQLNVNEIFGAIYNMIISQQVFADNIKGTYGDLVNKFRTDGTLYGDTKLFYSTDVLKSHAWGADAEAPNLLALDRPEDPECQAVTIDQFRQIRLTVDNYLSKRAWGTEGAFSNFNSVMLGWIGDTKKIYDATLINSFIGTTESEATRAVVKANVTTAATGLTGEEKNRVAAQTIAETMANLFVDMKDISRDFTDTKNLRSYSKDDLLVVWNSKYVNKLTKLDLPTIFHKDGIFDDFTNVLPARYFGDVVTSAVAKADNDGSYRSLIETDYTTATTVQTMTEENTTHVFPGDVIPAGTVKFDEVSNTLKTGILANEAYKVNDKIIAKVIHKDAVPYMSAFETSTSFFNPRSLTESHYLTFGYSTPCYLYDKPFITVEEI